MTMILQENTLSPEETLSEAMIQAGIRAYAKIVDIWQLKNSAAADILDVEPRTWTRMKGGRWSGKLTQDQTLRLSAIIGLYKGLHLYFSDQLADRWFLLPNSGPPFMGRAPMHYVSKGGLPALIGTRNYVDALRGGL